MPAVSWNVRQQIRTTVKRFKFEELETAVLPVFPEISWSRVKYKLVRNRETLTTPNALKIIDNEINKANISDKILLDRLVTLEVIDVSRHSKKKLWYGHEYKGDSDISRLTASEIQEKIMQNFKNHDTGMDVRAIIRNGFVFLSIKERPKKKNAKTIIPTFFSLVANENFFFCSKKTPSKFIITTVVEGLGFKGSRPVKLWGKDMHSLVRMLLARKTRALQGEIIKQPEPFVESPPKDTILGIDFTQHKKRTEYAQKCFGQDPPTFEILIINCTDQTWKHTVALERFPHEIINTRIEFISPSVPNFLKHLVTHKVLEVPLPIYAANVLSMGRNDLTVKTGLT